MSDNPLAHGLDGVETADPLAIVIFGATGDLTRQKLLPALFSLYLGGRLSRFRVIGFARRDWRDGRFRAEVTKMIAEVEATDSQRSAFLANLDYIQSTFEDPSGYARIPEACDGFTNRLYYLSTPPGAYGSVIRNLGAHDLADESEGYSRIIVEKPFGRDLSSARELNETLDGHFKEHQIYRIDHYLGKETVQNLMMLRFANGIFEPVWNNRYIDQIQITVAENAGVGTRGNYYEKSGALRDMIQNHAFQLLAITAMEPPIDTNPESIRGEKLKVIKSIDPVTFKDPDNHLVRAQYTDGVVSGESVPGYLAEDGVAADSTTETYAALRLYLDTWRWAGVPFYIRTGKRLSRKVTEIAVQFKKPPLHFFGNQALQQNVLAVRIQPDEGIALTVNAKIPGYATSVRPVRMEFSYGSSFGRTVPEAYERLLFDAMKGDNTLYTRRDEIEASWAFVTRILEYWSQTPGPLPGYAAGTSGPEAARDLMDRRHRWRRI